MYVIEIKTRIKFNEEVYRFDVNVTITLNKKRSHILTTSFQCSIISSNCFFFCTRTTCISMNYDPFWNIFVNCTEENNKRYDVHVYKYCRFQHVLAIFGLNFSSQNFWQFFSALCWQNKTVLKGSSVRVCIWLKYPSLE